MVFARLLEARTTKHSLPGIPETTWSHAGRTWRGGSGISSFIMAMRPGDRVSGSRLAGTLPTRSGSMWSHPLPSVVSFSRLIRRTPGPPRSALISFPPLGPFSPRALSAFAGWPLWGDAWWGEGSEGKRANQPRSKERRSDTRHPSRHGQRADGLAVGKLAAGLCRPHLVLASSVRQGSLW